MLRKLALLGAMILLFLLPVPAHAVQADPTITLPKTGQTVCLNGSGGLVACAGTGQDGDKLKGAAWPSPRFTDNGDNTMTDNLTGLMWTQDANLPAAAHTWQEALDYVSAMNSANGGTGTLGHNDWRLPNRKELLSLVNYDGQQGSATWLTDLGFLNVQDNYWTSSSFVGAPAQAWTVGFGDYPMTYHDDKTNDSSYYLWPVRGPVYPTLRLSPAGNDFGPVGAGTSSTPQLFTISNIGVAALSITNDIAVNSGDTALFSIDVGDGTNQTCGTLKPTLAAGGSCTFSVTFAPGSVPGGIGTKGALLKIISNDGYNPDPLFKTFMLAGTGANTHTVTFNSNGGSAVSSQNITDNSTATQPTDPARTGYTFAGWYSDSALTTAFVFTTPITGDTTLYAKWTALTYTINFASDANGSLTGVTSQTVNYGGSATAVTAVPASGYHFVNWTGTGGFVTTTANPLTVTNVTAAQTITANFTADPVNGACGSSNDGTFTVVPATNLCTSGTTSAVTGSGPWNWNCAGLNGGTTATCSAAIRSYSVTPSAGTGGNISPATAQAVNSNATTSFTVTPAAGYQIASVTGCGGSLSGATYTTGPITGNCTVSAGFSAVIVTPPPPAHDGIIIPTDGKTIPDIGDALKALQYLVGQITLSDTEKIHADVAPLGADGKPAGDGTVDVGDVVLILRRITGAISW